MTSSLSWSAVNVFGLPDASATPKISFVLVYWCTLPDATVQSNDATELLFAVAKIFPRE